MKKSGFEQKDRDRWRNVYSRRERERERERERD